MAKISVSAKALRIAAVVALLALIATMIYIGCGCSVGWTRETFADAAEAEADEADAADDVADGDAAESEDRVGHLADDGTESYADDDDAAKKKPLVATPKKDNETVGEMTKREIEELVLAAPGAARKAADAAAPKKSIGAGSRETGELSKREADLFEDLKSNKLSEKEIVNLVKTGVLNEALVEKFLSKLDSSAAQLALEDERMRGEMKRQPGLAKDDAAAAGSVEGFCNMAPGYAKW
jgi:hypothetical protein